MIIDIILLIIGGLLIMRCCVMATTNENISVLLLGVIGATIISTTTTCMVYENDKPTALDVYQGKTTLEITYKDGIAIDSTVVFKDKEK